MAKPLKPVVGPNRLPGRYKRQLEAAGISQRDIARESWRWHENRYSGEKDGHAVADSFVQRVLKGWWPCPAWLRRQLDAMLEEARRQPAK